MCPSKRSTGQPEALNFNTLDEKPRTTPPLQLIGVETSVHRQNFSLEPPSGLTEPYEPSGSLPSLFSPRRKDPLVQGKVLFITDLRLFAQVT